MPIDRKLLETHDTIFALATGALPCAVAIVRVSGPSAFEIARKHFRGGGNWEPQRAMAYGSYVSSTGEELDRILLLSFVAPHSFTGEHVIEIQCHGSIAVVSAIEQTLVEHGCRAAQAGEFSYRAFQNGKLGATDLENLGDLFKARDTADLGRLQARKDAALQVEIHAVREELIRLQAILDTAVDFSDEYGNVVEAARLPMAQSAERCAAIAARYELFRQGAQSPRLVLTGCPNAGKSSLFNALLCRYRAIVHETAGTTRDAIEEDLELEGRRWKLVDTAGLREGESLMERQGIEQSYDFLSAASFWVLVVDGTRGFTESERDLLARFGGKPHLIVWNKKDLPGFLPPPELDDTVVAVSALGGLGLEELGQILKTRIRQLGSATGVLPSQTQASRLRVSASLLSDLQSDLDRGVPPEVLGEKNRAILRSLDSVVGDVGVEEVLDRVFAEFCIGK
ncbi:tRNA uridine-5-carboxymethylaminomethyl(34) synthesis GTPase MnmE [bacterium]|nr:tRNA uridine-5-carboxymethylaminomethyl(34) synthesis GTPase MnmE [bacterium]